MKNISQILSLIFLLILTNNAFSQDLSHYLPENPESFQKYENDIYEERIKIFAISDEPLIRDFRVNEQVGNSEKQDVKSAIGDNGISMIVWSDYREGTLNIYGQLISLTGEMIGDNIKINENEDDNNYTYPNVAVNEDNNFLIVWIDGSSGYSVMGQLIDSDGNFIGSNFIIDDENNNSYKLFTSIGCNGKEFAIAWADARNGYTYDIYSQRLNKDVGKIGENFIVHSDSQTVSKTYPDIAIDKNNNLLVTWNSIIEGSYTTFASLVDTSGKIISSSFQLNDSTSVGASNYYPKVAPTDSGFVAVWYRYNAGTYDILGQFVNSSGTKIDSNIIINDSDIGSRNSPTIASDSSGKLFILWIDYRNNFGQLYAQELMRDLIVGTNFKITEDEINSNKNYPTLALSNSGKFITARREYFESSEYRIYSRLFNEDKIPITSSERVDNDSFSSLESDPSIEVFNDETFIVGWTDRRDRNYYTFNQKYNGDGTPVGTNKDASFGISQYNPQIIKILDENYLIISREYYRDVNNQNEIVAQKYFKTGEKLGDKFVVSDNILKGNCEYPNGASNSKGESVITWGKRINNSNRIYAQKLDINGEKVGEALQVSGDTTKYFYRPRVGIDSSGNFAITYYGYVNNNYDIFLNRFNNAGEQIDSVIIVNDVEPITTQYYPDISVNEQGNCIVTWYDYRNKNGVYFQQYKNIGSSDLFEKVDSNKSVADYIIQINHPRVSICNSSEFAISWSEFNGAYNDLKFRVYEETGTPLTEILYVTESQERDQINQDIIFADDKIYNVWQDNHELGVGYDIWANVYSMSELVTDIEENNLSLPSEFTLEQNYPNPFNPSTTIKYTIPNIANTKFASSTNVELKIYDILGREIKTLVNENQKPGSYEIKFYASNLSSGIYFYSLNAGEFHQVNKMMLLK